MGWPKYCFEWHLNRFWMSGAFTGALLISAAVRADQGPTTVQKPNPSRVESKASEKVPIVPNALIVLGASGTAEYGEAFRSAGVIWKAQFEGLQTAWIDGTQPQADKSLAGATAVEDDKVKLLKYLGAMVSASRLNEVQESGNAESIIGIEPQEVKGQGDALKVRWLVLIGHGTSDRSGHKFNLRGPDIEAQEIAEVLKVDRDRWVIINAFSSSGPFLGILSGPNRVVITATKSGAEQNYSRFATYLAESIRDPASDMNHDATVSVLEAFLVASSTVARFYSDANRLATEQALLDDNGDRRGTPANFYRGLKPVKAPTTGLEMDGDLAKRIAVHTLPTNYDLTPELNAKAIQIEEAIAALRRRKGELNIAVYQQELEILLLQLADVLGVGQE